MLMRVTTWVAIAALAMVSLLPTEEVVRTGLGGRAEHVLAYAGTALVAAMAYCSRRGRLRIALALIAYAAALEYLQRFSPTRSSKALDLIFSSAGVLIGISAYAVLAKLRARWPSLSWAQETPRRE
jgi:VanZ family protein